MKKNEVETLFSSCPGCGPHGMGRTPQGHSDYSPGQNQIHESMRLATLAGAAAERAIHIQDDK
jgi:hypothetical protein